MIKIEVGDLTYEFDNYEDAVDFLECIRRVDKVDVDHEHRYNHCSVNGTNYCACGQAEE